jgi:hypothetical protein
MKKLMILTIVAFGLSVVVQAADTVRVAPLSTAVTNVVQFTAKSGHITKPILFVHTTGAATTNTPVLTVTPASGAPAYTVYTGAALTSSAQAVIPMNSMIPLATATNTVASPQFVLMPGDILKITGTAAVWATSTYYMQVEEIKIQ